MQLIYWSIFRNNPSNADGHLPNEENGTTTNPPTADNLDFLNQCMF